MQPWTRASALRGFVAAAAAAGSYAEADAAPAPADAGRETPKAALARLTEGNGRYARDAGLNCNRNYDRRSEVSAAQSPFAVILGCADSRVPPEIIFDQRLGDLFVIRTAGNVADDLVLGSIEYAVEHFHPALVIVLGHERCGAVSATVDTLKTGAEPEGFTGSILKKIMPAARRARLAPGNDLHDAVRENVVDVVAYIRKRSTITDDAERRGALRSVGATYDLGTGRVTFLS